jgi:hypothetical protein
MTVSTSQHTTSHSKSTPQRLQVNKQSSLSPSSMTLPFPCPQPKPPLAALTSSASRLLLVDTRLSPELSPALPHHPSRSCPLHRLHRSLAPPLKKIKIGTLTKCPITRLSHLLFQSARPQRSPHLRERREQIARREKSRDARKLG